MSPVKSKPEKEYRICPKLCMTLFGEPTARGTTVIARKAKLGNSHVWRILAKERMPTAPTFHRLAKAFNMSMDDLYLVLYGHSGAKQVR
jgi:transcriptional regulator with XRE-family HTH domain